MKLLACVRDAAEAVAAIDAGFAGIAGPAVEGAAGAALGLRLAAGEAFLHEDTVPARRLKIISHLPDGTGNLLEALAAEGWDGVLLAVDGRLIDAVPLPDLGRLAAQGRAAGRIVAVAGGIEAPDVPRLAAAGADLALIGRALRREGALDPARLRAMAALAGTALGPARVPAAAGRRDRIFVRDLVRSLPIGAYASERGRLQRVRFSVEAEIAPGDRPAEAMGDIVSYDLIVDAITRITSGPHIELVESLAESIAAALLAVPRIELVGVRIEKLDLEPGSVGVEIERRKKGAS